MKDDEERAVERLYSSLRLSVKRQSLGDGQAYQYQKYSAATNALVEEIKELEARLFDSLVRDIASLKETGQLP